MKVVALAGGVGGAKLAHGLAQVVAGEDLTILVNTGDDFERTVRWGIASVWAVKKLESSDKQKGFSPGKTILKSLTVDEPLFLPKNKAFSDLRSREPQEEP